MLDVHRTKGLWLAMYNYNMMYVQTYKELSNMIHIQLSYSVCTNIQGIK